jgi:hypothetical protein
VKKQMFFLIVLLTLVFLSTGAGALSAPRHQVEAGIISGGSYQLTTFGAQAGNVASGGAYRLLGPAAPEQLASGCCCVYLPCILRHR